MRGKRQWVVTLLVSISLLGIGCTVNNGPGGSEITNGIVTGANGNGVSGITVTAYPERFIAGHYDATAVLRTQTDTDGKFYLPIDSGTYNIFIIDTVDGVGTLVAEIGPEEDLGVLQLEELGALGGTLQFANENPVGVVVYSPGTPYKTNVYAGNPEFRFELVPAGQYALEIAKQPSVGCPPGEDCQPAGGIPGNPDGTLTVVGGNETKIDTTINTTNLGELP